MARNKPIFYWDTNIFIAWVKNEDRPTGEMDGVLEIAEKIHRNEAILITSSLLMTAL